MNLSLRAQIQEHGCGRFETCVDNSEGLHPTASLTRSTWKRAQASVGACTQTHARVWARVCVFVCVCVCVCVHACVYLQTQTRMDRQRDTCAYCKMRLHLHTRTKRTNIKAGKFVLERAHERMNTDYAQETPCVFVCVCARVRSCDCTRALTCINTWSVTHLQASAVQAHRVPLHRAFAK